MKIADYAFFQGLCAQSFIDEIWLFGSRARQDHHQRADIDLALVCPKANEKNWEQILEIIEQADTLLKIDCIRLDTLSPSSTLFLAVQKEGIKLYAKPKSNA